MSSRGLEGHQLVALEDDISTTVVNSVSRGGNCMLRIAHSEFAFCLCRADVASCYRVAQAPLLAERIARA